mmetsp:Transcript_1799/g.4926  ORF Transcript_1799/g.4926 Transcript_1799/m.4926 type:complete len:161 (-) Transcript_1799:1864-2346(-)
MVSGIQGRGRKSPRSLFSTGSDFFYSLSLCFLVFVVEILFLLVPSIHREALDKSVLRKTKLKRKEGYQPLNREVLMESARKRWQENEERKANLRLLEEGWLKGKEERAKKRDKVMDVVDKERQAAEARRLLWLMERSEEWVPEENLDLAIAAAILEPTEL